MIGPRACDGCDQPVIEAHAGTRLLVLDYTLAPKGAVAARLDPDTDEWQARFLRFGEDHDEAAEVRFRQHDVTCKPRKETGSAN